MFQIRPTLHRLERRDVDVVVLRVQVRALHRQLQETSRSRRPRQTHRRQKKRRSHIHIEHRYQKRLFTTRIDNDVSGDVVQKRVRNCKQRFASRSRLEQLGEHLLLQLGDAVSVVDSLVRQVFGHPLPKGRSSQLARSHRPQ